ncbi:MAG: cell division protein FtsQ, partial [Bacteroidota bacterium]|nr:cell division protein FtsQ [Bacteroidota bacterium]
FELIPKIGDFRIILGSIDSIDTKIRNLKAFYQHAGSKISWDKYSKINLEYTNQIVCTKKNKNTL